MDEIQRLGSDYWRNLSARFEECIDQQNFDETISLTLMVSELFKDAQGDLNIPCLRWPTCLTRPFVLTSMKEYGGAESFYQRALAIRRKIFGETDPWFAVSLENLATLYHEIGNENEADDLNERAQGIFRSRVDDLNLQFSTLVDEGNYGEAVPLAIEVRDISRRVDGEISEGYAQSLNNAAFIYKQIAREYKQPEYFPVAEQLYREALDVWGKVLGETHEDYGVALNNLGELYRAMGEYSAPSPGQQSASL